MFEGNLLRISNPFNIIFMFDSSSSSLGDASREWRIKADETIRATLAELRKGEEANVQSQIRRSNIQQYQTQTNQHQLALAQTVQQGEENEKDRQEWAKNQITELNEQTKLELESIEALRARQQTHYQQQLQEKNEVWEKMILEKRAEATRLRNMITALNSEINVARSEAKADIDEAKRRAKESAKMIRANREKQIQQIAELTQAIQREKQSFDTLTRQNYTAASTSLAQKKEQLARLQSALTTMKARLREKENANSTKFRQQVRLIRDLRAQLQIQKDNEKSKQSELMSVRKMCTSISRKITAYKDETASLKRQLAMMTKDNEELQGEIVKLEKQMFPQVFRTQY